MKHAARSWLILFVWLAAPPAVLAAGPVFKCESNGSVTFQSTPCPSGAPRAQPSVERLNAEARKRREAEAAKAPAAPVAPVGATAPPAAGAQAAAPAPERFRCDGRQYCSQMTSCREAEYFLRNCPNVKMDGNRDGVPCQEQWCGR